jgi:hypothetical protein
LEERDSAAATLLFLTDDVLSGATPERLPDAKVRDQIVDAIAFLCSDESRGVTATAVAVDRARSVGGVFSAALYDAMGGKWTT